MNDAILPIRSPVVDVTFEADTSTKNDMPSFLSTINSSVLFILVSTIESTSTSFLIFPSENNSAAFLPITSVNCSEEDFQTLLSDARSRYFDNDGISLFDD